MVNDTEMYNMIRDISGENRRLAREIEVLKAQVARQPFANKTEYQALSNQTVLNPTIDGGTQEAPTVTDPVIQGPLTIQHDAGDAATKTTITPTDGTDEVTFSNNIAVNVGIFAATTVKIGDQTISEDGELVISDPVTPGIYIKDSGDAGVNATGYLRFVDSADARLGEIYSSSKKLYVIAEDDLSLESLAGDAKIKGWTDVRIYAGAEHPLQVRIEDGAIFPETDNDIDLGKAAQEFKDLYIDGVGYFDQLNMHGQINFANGTTYKVEADGDAYFKEGHFASHVYLKDNMKFYLGDGFDFQWYHDGANSYATNTTGTLYFIQNAAAGSTQFRLGGIFYIMDSDDANVSLFSLNTSGREIIIGGGVDPVTTYHYGNVNTVTHETNQLGLITRAWAKAYIKEVFDDDGTIGEYQEHDDLAILDNMKPWTIEGEIQRDKDNNPIIDYNTIPDFLKGEVHEDPDDEDSPVIDRKYIRPSLMAAFSWGAIRQLHQKVKDQEEVIIQLAEEVNKLKERN